jgi:hypothetical protein
MTTALYDKRTHTLGADTQNTTSDNAITHVQKIVLMKNGWYFVGAGHSYTIDQARLWAEKKFALKEEPAWDLFLAEPDKYEFSALAIDPSTDEVWYLDGELAPIVILDLVVGIGSGSSYGVGALLAGATMEKALVIAADHDPFTSAPFEVLKIDG